MKMQIEANPHTSHFSQYIQDGLDITKNPLISPNFRIQEKVHPKLPIPVLLFEGRHVNPFLSEKDFELVLVERDKYDVYSDKFYIHVPVGQAYLIKGKIASIQEADLRECGVKVIKDPFNQFVYEGKFLRKDHPKYNTLLKKLVDEKKGRVVHAGSRFTKSKTKKV